MWSHLKLTQSLVDVWQTSETNHSKSSLGNFQHQYLPEWLVNVYMSHLMMKSVSCCCVCGSQLFSNPVTYQHCHYLNHDVFCDYVHSECCSINHNNLRRCITILSLEEPLVMAATRPRLSHWNNAVHPENWGPHTAQFITIGNSSLAIVPTGSYFLAMTTETNGDLNMLHTPRNLMHPSQCKNQLGYLCRCYRKC